jgi:hypothetical protein
MKDEICGVISFLFLFFGIFFPEKPIFSIGCFIAFLIFAGIQVFIEFQKERNIFRK